MKPIYYDSLPRFTNRIVKNWIKTGVKHNNGNIQLIKYAWICKQYWANINGLKMAKKNKIDTNNLSLF